MTHQLIEILISRRCGHFIMQSFLVILLAVIAVCGAFTRQTRSMRGQVSIMARKPIMAGNWKMNTDLEVSGQWGLVWHSIAYREGEGGLY